MLSSTRYALSALEHLADPTRARRMQSYMKSEMPFLGVPGPDRNRIARRLHREHPPATVAVYRAQIDDLWNQPWRETRYLAIDVARDNTRFITLDQLDVYERLIREGAWWDLVDEVAAHLVGRLVLEHRASMKDILEAWIDDDDLWIRRTALIAQLGHGPETDATQLFAFCLRRADETDFFIRKAIGWALRQYSKTDPAAGRTFLTDHGDTLSGLSRREASKYL